MYGIVNNTQTIIKNFDAKLKGKSKSIHEASNRTSAAKRPFRDYERATEERLKESLHRASMAVDTQDLGYQVLDNTLDNSVQSKEIPKEPSQGKLKPIRRNLLSIHQPDVAGLNIMAMTTHHQAADLRLVDQGSP